LNFPEINKQFDEMLDQMSESMVFDGEVMSDDFQTLMREIHRKGGAKTKDAVLNLFDCMPLGDFMEGDVIDPSRRGRKCWRVSSTDQTSTWWSM
jgi:hypothetical protein